MASWAGNLVLKKNNREFISDVFTLFSAFSVKIIVFDCLSGNKKEYDLTEDGGFMSLCMKGKVRNFLTVLSFRVF